MTRYLKRTYITASYLEHFFVGAQRQYTVAFLGPFLSASVTSDLTESG